ncbi:MAG: sodium:solute symporter [Thermodesulfobacteriota bacterium]
MTITSLWLFIFVSMYWAYCVFWGIHGAMRAKTASDYFIAGRTIPVWVFVMAATATSFSGWTFMGHPGLIYQDGFQYAFASLYTITIPFTGVLFLRRQWVLGKRFGYVTPGEMLADYYRSGFMRILTVVVALFFSIPYLGLQLRASGFLFNVLSDNLLGVEVGMWLLSLVVILYVALGGLRSVAYVDTMQCILLATGILVVGVMTLKAVGGFAALNHGIASLAAGDPVRTAEGYSHYLAMPGAFQWVRDSAQATGGLWTGTMCLTYLFALMGIQASPAFSMWAFSNKDPRPFAPQQVWASSAGIGFLLIFFTVVQGMGGHLLGADPSAVESGIATDMLRVGNIMEMPGKSDMLVPALIRLLADNQPWLVGFLAICALAAMQSTGAVYLSTAGGILTRDVYKHYLNRNASHLTQMLFGRACVIALCGFALLVATTSSDALVLLGGLAVAYGFQMCPALVGVCWWPWLTRAGVNAGLVAGLVAVTLTDSIGPEWLGITAWGRWPLTVHSAGWGILFNLGTAVLVSALTQNDEERRHRQKFHDYLGAHCALPPHLKRWRPVAFVLCLTWFVFAIGPGAVVGNTAFGSPDDQATWLFGMPSIWAWQIIWWLLGVAMMWLLAYKLRMSGMPVREVVALVDDVGDRQ